MRNFEKNRFNPIDIIKETWPEADVSHIDFDPSLKSGEYKIIRQVSHDGTLIFSKDLLIRGVLNVARGGSYLKGKEPDWDRLVKIRYTVGWARNAVVFGKVRVGEDGHEIFGQKERFSMPVICHYVYGDGDE